MDESIKRVLSSYEVGLTAYMERLGESNATLQKAMDAYRKLCTHAESARDMMSFYADQEVSRLMADLSVQMGELAKEKPARGVRTVPPASAAAAGYHLAYDQLPKELVKTRAVYDRIFEIEKNSENALVFTRVMAEEGLYLKMSSVPMMEKQEGMREDVEKKALPVMMNYYEKMREKIPAAGSVAELEYQAGLEAEVAQYQNLWDTLLLNTSETLLGNAIAGWMLTQSENDRQEVENACRFIAEFYGLDFDGLYGIPRIKDHFSKIVFETVKGDLASKGVDTPDKFIETLRKAVEACLEGREPVAMGPESNRTLTLWGKDAEMKDLERAYRMNFYSKL